MNYTRLFVFLLIPCFCALFLLLFFILKLIFIGTGLVSEIKVMASVGPTSGILNCTSFRMSIETYKKMHKGLNISNTLFFIPLTGKKFMVTFSNNHTVKEVFLAFLEKYHPGSYEKFNAPGKFDFYYGTHYGINLKGEHPIQPNQRVEYRFDPRVKSYFLDRPVNTILPKDHVFSAVFYNLSEYDFYSR